jgi:hypothetical protein
MTLTFTRAAIALAIVLGLAGCGGTASFQVAGTVEGLSNKGLILTNNGTDLAVAADAKSFAYPNSISYGEQYNVMVKQDAEHHDCVVGAFVSQSGVTLNSGSDTAGRLASINIGVHCALETHTIGGKVTGLTSDGLVLTNGSFGGTVAVTKPAAGTADVLFTFPNPVTYGVSYGVTVLTQPASDICTVTANGTGVMGDLPVPATTAATDTTGIVVTCVAKPASA